MTQPKGTGPFPVLLLNHGYYPRERYWPGADTWQAADYFARHGYLTLASDYRSWGEAERGLSLFHSGLVVDLLNLMSAVPSLPQADPNRIGMWGHSMGGGITTKVLVVDARVKAAVLYAPNSAEDADLLARWGPGCRPEQSEAEGDMCNPADILLPDTPPELVEAYLAGVSDPAVLEAVSPIYHLDHVQVPVQIHIGTADGQTLSGTPPEWSEKLAAALETAGKDVDLHIYEGQGHFFQGESWTLMLARATQLFDAHLKQ